MCGRVFEKYRLLVAVRWHNLSVPCRLSGASPQSGEYDGRLHKRGKGK